MRFKPAALVAKAVQTEGETFSFTFEVLFVHYDGFRRVPATSDVPTSVVEDLVMNVGDVELIATNILVVGAVKVGTKPLVT